MLARTGIGAAVLGGLALVTGILVAPPAHAADDGATWTAPVFPSIDRDQDPDESYELVALGIIRTGHSGWRSYRGKYRDVLAQEDFLAAVGRRDLADQMRTSRTKADILAYGGGIVAFTGLLLLVANASPGGMHVPPALGWGLCAGGAVSWFVSGHVNIASPNADQAESFAKRYNDGLRGHIEQQQTPRNSGTLARGWAMPIIVPLRVGGSLGTGFSARFTF